MSNNYPFMDNGNPVMRHRTGLPMNERMLMLEGEVGRLQSDYVSEKDTRARANKDLLDEIKGIRTDVNEIQKRMWMAVGAIAMVTWLIQIFHK